MHRIVSFVVLVVILLLFGALFFRVIAGFLVPLFLALVLVVLFRPLYVWMVKKCRGRTRVAAVLTTVAVLLAVLIPFSLVLTVAGVELTGMIVDVDKQQFNQQVDALRQTIGACSGSERLFQIATAGNRDVDRRMPFAQQIQRVNQILMPLHCVQIADRDHEPCLGRESKLFAKRDRGWTFVSDAVRNHQQPRASQPEIVRERLRDARRNADDRPAERHRTAQRKTTA